MIHDIPLMRSLDPHHARLGYLGVCAAAGVRTLDTYDALVSRMKDVLFERFYTDEPAFQEVIDGADPAARAELLARSRRSTEEDPSAILNPPDSGVDWLTRSEGWLYDRHMPSHVGFLQERHLGRAVDLARWTGVLLPTLDLSEDGALLQFLVSAGAEQSWRNRNLLRVQARPALVLHYLKLLLRAEVLFPALLTEFAEREARGDAIATRGPRGLLRHSVQRLSKAIGEPTDPADVLPYRALVDFAESVTKTSSTEENYLRPRLEILVDLGLVARRGGSTGEKAGAFTWSVSPVGRAVAQAWEWLSKHPLKVDEYLDKDFIQTCAPLVTTSSLRIASDQEILSWFAHAFRELHRDIGFTPGRTVAQLASLLAAEIGVRVEIDHVFRVVYASAQSQYGPFLKFSGGSRFDNEFLIRVEPEISSLLPPVPPSGAQTQ